MRAHQRDRSWIWASLSLGAAALSPRHTRHARAVRRQLDVADEPAYVGGRGWMLVEDVAFPVIASPYGLLVT